MKLPASANQGFKQEPPVLQNQYEDDPALQGILFHYLPHSDFEAVTGDLKNLGQRAITDILALGDNAEQHHPTLTQYDHWCRRIDKLETSEGWRALKGVAAEEGLIAIGYERKLRQFSRVYQFAKLYVAGPSMAMYTCPLAMTDGAARLIELHGTQDMKETAFARLTSRDPAKFWTSGQWMTERPGGSDVGGTETEAVKSSDGRGWLLSGFKWFSSATDSDMTFLLARTRDQSTGSVKEGSRGLSLFYAKLRDSDGNLNGIRVHRLKNKFGTKALPTAELELDNLPGSMVGSEHRGVATIAVILNITRIHSALCTTSSLRRSYAIAKSYAEKRVVFGKSLSTQPLHLATLADIDMTLRGAMQLFFFAVLLLGESECHPDESRRALSGTLLRITTPLLKMWVCHEAMPAITEALEACGGQGYMEETGIARQLRDAQVNSIWEGTTNVQALDLLRIVGPVFPVYRKKVLELVSHESLLKLPVSVVKDALDYVQKIIVAMQSWERDQQEAKARLLGFALARILIGALLIDHGVYLQREGHGDAEASLVCAKRWCANVGLLVGQLDAAPHSSKEDLVLVYGKSSRAML
ncbi:uncharacterized protein SPPG_05543 [Spizellomyces punctatus DAOM BR117]|uniref:Acyl-CoA dehydrogenase n=1 Tax=Spizellomyces punctatus (strain DAOM BR117) TaxID=645134 RepID=A0A0L0HE84_SPIPD|nr:uncharacterized protein SPPG_05543 [Spizellomyces punctatus DAOM BR117]KNC99289.1 hypothetical protein SPPG_05543 [Spizellomyces punctatus DAOM BR117]|eukprot:XP_016607329.1 hypothetical protein SPPG_05543 [Spizellomyces punctatus DAOM BR117]